MIGAVVDRIPKSQKPAAYGVRRTGGKNGRGGDLLERMVFDEILGPAGFTVDDERRVGKLEQFAIEDKYPSPFGQRGGGRVAE